MGVRRCSVLFFALGLVAAACGDDDGGTSATGAPDSAPTTVAMATTTTAAWGEVVDPGAEGMVMPSNVLLREDFQDGDIGDWSIDAGWYVLSAGERRLLAAGGAAWGRFDDGEDWSRYAARFGVLIHHGSLGLSVAVGDTGRYLVHLTDTGVYLLKDSPFGSFATLGSAQPVAPGDAHAVAVGVDGGHLQVYLDGVLLIDATDPNPLPGGTIGLGAADGSSVQVDNIVVAGLRGPLPTLQAAGESASAAPEPAFVDLGPVEEPDLVTANLELVGVSYPEQVDPGESFDVGFTVINRGSSSVGAFSVAWSSAGSSCDARFDGLAAGEAAELDCRVPAYATAGDYEWVAAADSTGMIDEGAHEDDNLAAGTITVGVQVDQDIQPNLAVSWFTLHPPFPAPGEPVGFEFGIVQTEPAWDGTRPSVELRLTGGDDSMGCSAVVPPGEVWGRCELAAFPEVGEYRFNMELDAGQAVAESNERDNTGLVTIVISTGAAAGANLVATTVSFDPDPPRAGVGFVAWLWVVTTPFTDNLPYYTMTFEVDEVMVCSHENDMGSGGDPCDVPALAPGQHTYRFVVDAGDVVAEPDEEDNEFWGRFTVNP